MTHQAPAIRGRSQDESGKSDGKIDGEENNKDVASNLHRDRRRQDQIRVRNTTTIGWKEKHRFESAQQVRSSGACEETIGGISRARSAWEWQEDKGVRQRPALDITAITDSRNLKISSTPSPVGCPRLSFGKAKKIEREIEGACSYKRTYLGEMHLPRHAAQLVIPRGACHASRLDRYR